MEIHIETIKHYDYDIINFIEFTGCRNTYSYMVNFKPHSIVCFHKLKGTVSLYKGCVLLFLKTFEINHKT